MIELVNETAMQAFGEKIGHNMAGGAVIELVGDVGAGKTTFVRGLARGMGIDETVQSPSFTISRVYDAPNGLVLAHYDFYRLEDAGIMADELDETLHAKDSVVVVEWAGAVNGVLPDDRLTLTIASPTPTSREVVLEAGGQLSKQLMEAVL